MSAHRLKRLPAPLTSRPSKTRKLFAMLACRSSIMVGKVLNPAQMTKVSSSIPYAIMQCLYR